MRRLFAAFLMGAFIFASVAPAQADTDRDAGAGRIVSPGDRDSAPDVPAGVSKAKNVLLDYFSPAVALIGDVEDGSAAISIGSEVNVKKGMRFSVFRDGEPFYHPVTNELIGRNEIYVGRIEVTEGALPGGTSRCRVIEGDIKSGDIARITSSRIKLAYFQDRKADWDISEAFFKSLKDSGRFEILESYTPTYEPEELSELARKLGAEAVLMFSTHKKGGRKLLNIKLYWAQDARMFGNVEEELSHNVMNIITPEEEFISTVFTEKEPWGNYEIPGGFLMAMGDVDGNGARELVVSDGQDIKIYSIGKDLKEIWSVKGGSVSKHISLDILDMNKNGRAEIFITTLYEGSNIETGDTRRYSAGNKVRSFVIEYDPSEGYRKIEDNMPYFMRVAGKRLFMQKFSSRKIFSGPVYEGQWMKETYKPGMPLQLPADANIYGFAFIDWQNSGKNQIMTFDDEGYLNLYNEGGILIWRSSKSFGIFPLSFKSRTRSVANPVNLWSIRGRLLSVKTERGQEVVIVRRVPVLSNVPGLGVQEAEVYSLWWNDGTMEEKVLMDDISGDITDYWIEGSRLFLLSSRDLLSAVKKAVGGELSRGSTLYFYNLGDK